MVMLVRESSEERADEVDRCGELVATNAEAGVHVTGIPLTHAQCVVEVDKRVVPAGVHVEPGRACDRSEDTEFVRVVCMQDGGSGEAVDDGLVRERKGGDLRNIGRDARELICVGKIKDVGATEDDTAAQQPVTGDALVQPQQLFAYPERVSMQDPVADVVGQRTEIGDMVVAPLELEEERPEVSTGKWCLDTERVFDGKTVCEVVANGGVARDALCEFDTGRVMA